MSNEKSFSTSETETPNGAPDLLDDLIRDMFVMRDMALIENLDTDELEALAKLGRTEECIEEIPSLESLRTSVYKQLNLPTMCDLDPSDETVAAHSDETVAEPGSVFCVEHISEEFDVLMSNFQNFDEQDIVTYTLELRKSSEIGRGGQGVVYMVKGDKSFSKKRAMKIFSPKSYENATSFVSDMERIEHIVSQIVDKPHDDLVDIDWFGKHDGVYIMMMRYVDGFDLRSVLQPSLLQDLKQCVSEDRWSIIDDVVYSTNGSQHLALQPAIAVYLIERVLRGLAALHKMGIVHGDIKPSNIMLNASGSVKIIDVGSAFMATKPPDQHHVTPAYVAPEYLNSGVMTFQSDLASVGYVLIELISGKSITEEICNPDESSWTIGEKTKQDLLEAKNSLPYRLEEFLPPKAMESDHLMELCRRLIDPDPSRRFRSAAESIVDAKGTFQFYKDLVQMNLAVCNFEAVSRWLADVKHATQWAGENS